MAGTPVSALLAWANVAVEAARQPLLLSEKILNRRNHGVDHGKRPFNRPGYLKSRLEGGLREYRQRGTSL